jgi:putative methylase
MQKRLVRKLDLEMFLSQVKPHPSPTPSLEQYTILVDVAATMLYAAYINDDIADRRILDLGCGTGRLTLGAAFLEAKEVVGVDIDKTAVRTAQENARKTGFERRAQWIVADIGAVHGNFDTVLQNPPFGVQRRGADRKFLAKAIEAGKVVYSLHKNPGRDGEFVKRLERSRTPVVQTEPSPFLTRFIQEQGGTIRAVYAMVMTVPYMFQFHTKRKHHFIADLYIIERR